MNLCWPLRVFIWFAFLYRDFDCALYDVTTGQLSKGQQRQLYNELESLSQQRQKQLFNDLERQRQDFEQSSSKWSRLRQTQYDDLSTISQADVENISETIRNGGSPVIRNKRTLKFLVKSLAEILGLRWTLLKYSLIPGVVNSVIGPPPASPAPPAKPAPGAPSQPPPKNPPPPRQPPPPPPPPTKNPPPPAPAPSVAAPPPPTIPPNQIDPNTIRYPFRPAPTIPFLNFAPLPPGVTVPYPPLFQWPSPSPAMPPQPPCAAPPPAAPKNPPPPPPRPPARPPSRLPLPKPRAPVPPPPPPVKPVLPASPGKTPLKLEYDQPVRIEIFNNVKPHLPVSSNVYSGDPVLQEIEEKDENQQFLNPTQAIQDIDDHYTNTENSQDFRHDDDDFGFLTKIPKYFSQTTPQHNSDYDHTEKIRDYDDDHENYEDTTPIQEHNSFVDHSSYEDYPEQAEENRANVNIKVRHPNRSVRKPKRISKLKKGKTFYDARRNIQSVFNHSSSTPSWKVQSFPSRNHFSTTEFPKNHAHNWRKTPRRISKYRKDIEHTTPKNSFRIVVPDFSSRKRRDIFFDEAFKSFNFSAFDSFNDKMSLPESTQAQFLESNGKLIPNLDYRKKLEKDIESYVEKYVEQQISQGEIDVTKPKTTIIELKPKVGPPIKTVTTTLSKIVDGDKSFLETVLDYSKDINPVSNVAELSGVEEPDSVTEKSEVAKAFTNENFETPFSWNLSG